VRRHHLTVAVVAHLALTAVACIDDNIPPRPLIAALDAGEESAPADGGDGGAGEDGGALEDGGAGAACGFDAGTTDAGPVLLASTPSCGDIKLVVSACTLFWTEEARGTVRSVSTSGGPPTTIASSQLRPGAIAVDSTTVFWVASLGDPDDSTLIQRAPTFGGGDSVFFEPQPFPKVYGDENHINALLVSNGVLFFGRYTYAERIPTDGETPTVIGHSPDLDLGRPGAFAIDATYLYQVEEVHNAVSREKLDGTQMGFLEGDLQRAPGAPDRIATSQSDLLTDAIGMVDDHVVWAAGSSIYRKSGSAPEGDPATLVATTVGGGDVTGFVVSDRFVYFGEGGANTVQVSAVYDGTPRIIATGQPFPGQFAADAQNVYWRTSDCKIMKLAK
jgi:hypothetical protein